MSKQLSVSVVSCQWGIAEIEAGSFFRAFRKWQKAWLRLATPH